MSAEFVDGSERTPDRAREPGNLEGKIVLAELLPPAFMVANTNFGSIQEMFDSSGFTIESWEDLEAIPANQWDEFVASHTQFASWGDMTSRAFEEWTLRSDAGSIHGSFQG